MASPNARVFRHFYMCDADTKCGTFSTPWVGPHDYYGDSLTCPACSGPLLRRGYEEMPAKTLRERQEKYDLKIAECRKENDV